MQSPAKAVYNARHWNQPEPEEVPAPASSHTVAVPVSTPFMTSELCTLKFPPPMCTTMMLFLFIYFYRRPVCPAAAAAAKTQIPIKMMECLKLRPLLLKSLNLSLFPLNHTKTLSLH